MTQESSTGRGLCSAVEGFDSSLASYTKGTDGLSSGAKGVNSTLQVLVANVFMTGSFVSEVQT